jgi:hypothetical protein
VIKNVSFLFAAVVFAQAANAGVVKNICEKQPGFGVISLKYREADGNRSKIIKINSSKSPLLKYVKEVTGQGQLDETSLAKKSQEGNEKFIPGSKYKDLFLKYSTSESKLKDPEGYRASLVQSIKEILPGQYEKLSWFLNLRDKRLSASGFRPASKSEINEVYGAVARLTPSTLGKFSLEIIFSNNDSEALPYLIPLIAHELQHASNYGKQIELYEKKKELAEFAFLDEAVAFNIQLQTYVELAKKNPEIFCNWLYPSWSYGDLVIPLSWSMNAMEEEFTAGAYLPRYAMQGSYKDHPELLNDAKTDLRSDLKAKIKKMNLRFVK